MGRKEREKKGHGAGVGGWGEINKPLQDSRTRKVGRRGLETNTQERQHDYRLEKYTSLCRRLLSSEHCNTGGWGVGWGGSYPGFGMMSPRDQSLASSDWPCLLELEGSQGEDGGGVGGWVGLYAGDEMPVAVVGEGERKETESRSGFVLPTTAPAHHSTVVAGPEGQVTAHTRSQERQGN